jgi:ethanolamine ammonia-lyase large subunit
MLSYQTTSYHDTPTLRQLFKLRPAAEFEAWLESLGLMKDGVLTDQAGDPTFFLRKW